jgi:hypothetical protein
MFVFDLAALYGVATKVLNQAVKRNRDRFPTDFMFQLTRKKAADLKSQSETSSLQTADVEQNLTNRSQVVTGLLKHRETRSQPYVFTEQGVAMLSSARRDCLAELLS